MGMRDIHKLLILYTAVLANKCLLQDFIHETNRRNLLLSVVTVKTLFIIQEVVDAEVINNFILMASLKKDG